MILKILLCQYCSRSFKVFDLLSSGVVPSEVISHLCGASRLALRKKNGGLQPIAVGEVMRRLTSKCISQVVNMEAQKISVSLSSQWWSSAGF